MITKLSPNSSKTQTKVCHQLQSSLLFFHLDISSLYHRRSAQGGPWDKQISFSEELRHCRQQFRANKIVIFHSPHLKVFWKEKWAPIPYGKEFRIAYLKCLPFIWIFKVYSIFHSDGDVQCTNTTHYMGSLKDALLFYRLSRDSFNINGTYKAGSMIQCSPFKSETSNQIKYTSVLHRISMSRTVFNLILILSVMGNGHQLPISCQLIYIKI